MPVIEEVVVKIEDWQGRNVSIHPLPGGLTNTNFKVEVDGTLILSVFPGKARNSWQLTETTNTINTKAAAEAGVGPQVLYHLPEYNVMVLEFLDGKTMSKESLNAPGMPRRMAQSIKRLQQVRASLLTSTCSA